MAAQQIRRGTFGRQLPREVLLAFLQKVLLIGCQPGDAIVIVQIIGEDRQLKHRQQRGRMAVIGHPDRRDLAKLLPNPQFTGGFVDPPLQSRPVQQQRVMRDPDFVGAHREQPGRDEPVRQLGLLRAHGIQWQLSAPRQTFDDAHQLQEELPRGLPLVWVQRAKHALGHVLDCRAQPAGAIVVRHSQLPAITCQPQRQQHVGQQRQHACSSRRGIAWCHVSQQRRHQFGFHAHPDLAGGLDDDLGQLVGAHRREQHRVLQGWDQLCILRCHAEGTGAQPKHHYGMLSQLHHSCDQLGGLLGTGLEDVLELVDHNQLRR